MSNELFESEENVLVLGSTSGAAKKAKGTLEGDDGIKVASAVFNMLQDVNGLIVSHNKQDRFQRLVVSLRDANYLISILGQDIVVVYQTL
jgi:hypothetical protein